MFKLETPATCKHGHELTPENLYRSPKGQRYCRTCKQERQDEERERARAKLEAFLIEIPSKPPISPQLAAWVARKRRERDGRPLRRCDREQVSEQLEDLGTL